VATDADYRIHTLIYDPATLDLSAVVFGETSAVVINSLLLQGGGDICAALDVTGVQFRFGGCGNSCLADAGTLTPSDDFVCFPSNLHLQAEVQDAPLVPAGFSVLYVLTRTNSLIIEGVSDTPQFMVQEAGDYRIHTLVFDPSTLDLSIVEFGVTTGFDVNGLLQQGGGDICGALDVSGAAFHVADCECEADFGFIFPIGHGCLDGSILLRTFVLLQPTVPAGFEVLYVLTSGEELVIEAVNDIPAFAVQEAGRFTIHTLVYDPTTLDLSIVEFGVTTGFDVNELLQQGGGDICAALDVEGAEFQVEDCGCEADFGHIFPSSHECLAGSVDLEATVLIPPTVPAGFEVLYVLTSGEELVIEAVNSTPEFTVEETGIFTIHTLVYDPATLDLSIVEFGVTTGFDVNGLLQQGGGDICAALDVAGAHFSVEECPCEANFGHIFPSSDECLDGNAALEATVFTSPTVPAGFEVLYVLTSGEELVIEAVNSTPEFTVEETGIFTIHTLVYDPATLDLSIVEFGVTTGFDVNGLLQQGGGDICAALDVAGAHFSVEECPCEADFGHIFASSDECFDGSADLEATVQTPPTVPPAYEVLYVLTSGEELVIEAVNDLPEFAVEETGLFTIHTLVYNPLTLDLSIVEFGVTTGFDVNGLLQQGGGDICAVLDVAGAQFDVEECSCEAAAGVLKRSNDPCLENGEALIDFEELTPPVVPDNYEVLYVLTSGNDFIIEQVSTDTDFTVGTTGRFTAHTLVYNPATLDLSGIEFGVTSAFTVNSLLIQGGGDICAALDLAGLAYDIEICTNLLPAGTLYPNPVQDLLQLRTPDIYLEQGMRISIFGVNGQLMKTKVINEPQALESVFMGDLPAGTYQIVMEGLQSGYRGAQVLKF
ncbi:MAG: T9SS type A sorting domain-containing protein, partial [Bacteroidota bacterium]